MKTFNKLKFSLYVLLISIAFVQPAESNAQGWAKFGKTILKSFARNFGKAAAEVSVEVLAEQLKKQINRRGSRVTTSDFAYIQLYWNYYGSQHSGILTLGENGGFLRIAFYNAQLGRIEAIDQTLELREMNGAFYLFGSTPKYAGTNRPHPGYLPDILLLKQDYYGKWYVAQVGDQRGYFVPVVQSAISRTYKRQYPQLFR